MICTMKTFLCACMLSKTDDNILHVPITFRIKYMLLGFQIACDVNQTSCLIGVYQQPFMCYRFATFFVSACRCCLLFFMVEKAHVNP